MVLVVACCSRCGVAFALVGGFWPLGSRFAPVAAATFPTVAKRHLHPEDVFKNIEELEVEIEGPFNDPVHGHKNK